jgi:hypothetical protein
MRLFSNLLNRNPLTRWFKNVRNRCLNALFLKQAAEKIQLPPEWRPENHAAICFSIAFNHPVCVEILIESWCKFARNTELVIVDNSSKKEAREQICALCAKYGIPYIGLPFNWEWSVNRSHAISMNWIYYNLVLKWNPSFFGFLDHDCFPFAPFDLQSSLKNLNMMGLRRNSLKKPQCWNLWAGFCFFRLSRLNGLRINFTHDIELGLDTGGSNWQSLYSKADTKEQTFVNVEGSVVNNSFYHAVSLGHKNKNWTKNQILSDIENASKLHLA